MWRERGAGLPYPQLRGNFFDELPPLCRDAEMHIHNLKTNVNTSKIAQKMIGEGL